jgi:hypothetical protein
MERSGMPCTGRLFFIWSLYAAAVAVVSQFVAARGYSAPVGWAIALAMGLAVLAWTREI